MRHLGSLLAGLLITPAAWLLLAVGQPQTSRAFAVWIEQDAYNTADLVGPIAYLAVAGLIAGSIASLRLSPAGPVLAALLYLTVYGMLFANPLSTINGIPRTLNLGITEAQPRIPVTNGTLAALACCLLVAAASRQRWAQWPQTAPAEAAPAAEVGLGLGLGLGLGGDDTPLLPAADTPNQPITLGQALRDLADSEHSQPAHAASSDFPSFRSLSTTRSLSGTDS